MSSSKREIEFYSPTHLAEAFDLLDDPHKSLKICAGMTHLLRFYPDFPDSIGDKLSGLLHIGNIDSLAESKEENHRYHMGGTASIAALATDPYVARYAPAVVEAAMQTSTPQIRNRRTLAGEIAWGSFHSPLVVALTAMEAKVRVRLRGEEGAPGREETWDLTEFYDGKIERQSIDGKHLISRQSRTRAKDLITKLVLSHESLHAPGRFSFFKALTPKISTENSGVVLAVSGIALNGMIQSAHLVASGLWMWPLETRLPLEGVKTSDLMLFEKLYNFCDRFSLDKYRREGPSAAQLGLVVFGLLKEGFSSLFHAGR